MNLETAILVSPMGCFFSLSSSSQSFQHNTQAYVHERQPISEAYSRGRVVRTALRYRRVTPDVVAVLGSHLAAFDLRETWSDLSRDEKMAAVAELHSRICLAAAGRYKGMAMFGDPYLAGVPRVFSCNNAPSHEHEGEGATA